MFKFRIRTNAKTGSKSLKSKSTAVTGSTNSKSTTENLSKTNSATNLNSPSSLSKPKSQISLIETADSLEKDDKYSLNKLEVVAEVNEIEQSEHSKSSKNYDNEQQSVEEEVVKNPKEKTQKQLNNMFNIDPIFTKSTRDFVQKLATHFFSQRQHDSWMNKLCEYCAQSLHPAHRQNCQQEQVFRHR